MVLLCALFCAAAPSDNGRVAIPAGRFAPLFGLDTGQKDFPIAAFSLDAHLVSDAEFAAFVRAHPEWRKG